MSSINLTANDISCGHCKASIEEGLSDTAGVQKVSVDIDTKVVHVDYDEATITPEVIRAKLDDIGYPAA